MMPYGYDWVEAVTCSTDFTSHKVSTEDEFKTMLSQSVSVGGSVGYSGVIASVSASFSASSGFKQAKEEMAKGSNTKIFSTVSKALMGYLKKSLPGLL